MIKLIVSLLLLSSPCYGAWALIDHCKGTNSAGCTITSTTGADFLLVQISSNGSMSGQNISDSVGGQSNSCWALANTATVSSAYSTLFYCPAPAHVGATHTFTITGGPSIFGTYASAWSGSKLTSPLDQTSTTTPNGTGTAATASITPTTNNQLVIYALGAFGASGTPSISPGTIVDSSNNGGSSYAGGVAYQIQTTAAAASATWTFSNCYTTVAASFFSAAASSTVIHTRFVGIGK